MVSCPVQSKPLNSHNLCHIRTVHSYSYKKSSDFRGLEILYTVVPYKNTADFA